jgi:hypothetical protein
MCHTEKRKAKRKEGHILAPAEVTVLEAIDDLASPLLFVRLSRSTHTWKHQNFF